MMGVSLIWFIDWFGYEVYDDLEWFLCFDFVVVFDGGLKVGFVCYKELCKQGRFIEDIVNDVGYEFFGGVFELVVVFFECNVKVYLKFGNVYDSFGEVLFVVGCIVDVVVSYWCVVKFDLNNKLVVSVVQWIEVFVVFEKSFFQVGCDWFVFYVGDFGLCYVCFEEKGFVYQCDGNVVFFLILFMEDFFVFDGMNDFCLCFVIDDMG